MKNAAWLKTLATTVTLSIIIVALLYCLTEGWPLMVSPKIENIEMVTVTEHDLGLEKEFTDAKNIELAVKLINFLNVVPFSAVSNTDEPLISIKYSLKDGSEINVSANNTAVFLNDKGHRLKEPEIFVDLAKGIFFFAEYASSAQ